MLSDEEKKTLEQARSNITRGNDIESAMLILEKCALDGVIFTGGRLNIFKIAVRQILNFLKEYKDKGYLDVVREKVKANETIEKQSKEIEELKQIKCKLDEKNIPIETLLAEFERLEDLEDDLTTVYLNGVYDGEKKVEDKIKAKIEELEKEKNIPEEMDFKAFYRIKDLKNIEIAVLQSLLDKE